MGWMVRPGRGTLPAGPRDLLVLESWPHQGQHMVGGGLAERAVPHEQAKPQGAIEDIEGVVDVQVGSQLAGGNAFLQGCRPPGSALGEDPVPEVLRPRRATLA